MIAKWLDLNIFLISKISISKRLENIYFIDIEKGPIITSDYIIYYIYKGQLSDSQNYYNLKFLYNV